MNLDKAFDIYEEFLLQAKSYGHFETARCNGDGREILLLKFDCGFTVELTNNQYIENSAVLRCWWKKEDDAVNVNSLEQLLREFANSN